MRSADGELSASSTNGSAPSQRNRRRLWRQRQWWTSSSHEVHVASDLDRPVHGPIACSCVARRCLAMKVLAADGYILCSGLLRTLTLLYDDVRVTAANSIDELLARISELPDPDLVLLDTSMPGMENFAGLRLTVEKLPEVPIVV